MRVDAHCAVDLRVVVDHLDDFGEVARVRPHGHHVRDPVLKRPGDNGAAVLVVFLHFEVAMGIDEHDERL